MRHQLILIICCIAYNLEAQTVSNLQYQYTSKGELKTITENGVVLNNYYDATGNRITASQIVVDVTEVANSFPLRCYPNPTQAFVTTEVDFNEYTDLQINISNSTGQILVSDQRNKSIGKQHYVLDFSAYPKGIYFIQIIANKARQTVKIIRL